MPQMYRLAAIYQVVVGEVYRSRELLSSVTQSVDVLDLGWLVNVCFRRLFQPHPAYPELLHPNNLLVYTAW